MKGSVYFVISLGRVGERQLILTWRLLNGDRERGVLVDGGHEPLPVGLEEENEGDGDVVGAVAGHGEQRADVRRRARNVVQHDSAASAETLHQASFF